MGSNDESSEIAFFDVETTVPTRTGQGYAILEFGAILVCSRKLEELLYYSSLVRPADPSLITPLSVRCNGITPDAVISAPSFAEISDTVHDLLHGRIWAGHNIIKFDCKRIREAFVEINRAPPEPKGIIDSLDLLTKRFGRRAGDMKMATLATYFRLKPQTHRCLDDVRLNLEVLKHCATVLFLESSFPDIFTDRNRVCQKPLDSVAKTSLPWDSTQDSFLSPSKKIKKDKKILNSQKKKKIIPKKKIKKDKRNLILKKKEKKRSKVSREFLDPDEVSIPDISALLDPLYLGSPRIKLSPEFLDPDKVFIHDISALLDPLYLGSPIIKLSPEFLDPDEVSIPDISALLDPLYIGSPRIKLLHKDLTLQISFSRLRVIFGISTGFVDHVGQPRLSFVVDVPPTLCRVLDACDDVVQVVSLDSGGSSKWIPVVTWTYDLVNYPTARLHIPIVVNEDVAQYATEMYQKRSSGATQKLVFSKFDAAELDSFIKPGTLVDAYFSLDPYDYERNAGIQLVAKKLIIHSE